MAIAGLNYNPAFPLKRLASLKEVSETYIYLMINSYTTGTSIELTVEHDWYEREP